MFTSLLRSLQSNNQVTACGGEQEKEIVTEQPEETVEKVVETLDDSEEVDTALPEVVVQMYQLAGQGIINFTLSMPAEGDPQVGTYDLSSTGSEFTGEAAFISRAGHDVKRFDLSGKSHLPIPVEISHKLFWIFYSIVTG